MHWLAPPEQVAHHGLHGLQTPLSRKKPGGQADTHVPLGGKRTKWSLQAVQRAACVSHVEHDGSQDEQDDAVANSPAGQAETQEDPSRNKVALEHDVHVVAEPVQVAHSAAHERQLMPLANVPLGHWGWHVLVVGTKRRLPVQAVHVDGDCWQDEHDWSQLTQADPTWVVPPGHELTHELWYRDWLGSVHDVHVLEVPLQVAQGAVQATQMLSAVSESVLLGQDAQQVPW